MQSTRGSRVDGHLAQFPEVAMHKTLWQGLPSFGSSVIGLFQAAPIHMFHHQQQAVCAGIIDHLQPCVITSSAHWLFL